MKLLDSLLDAIVRLEGDALVMHVGEKPYVITASSAMSAYRGPLAWGQVELSSRVLTFDAVSSMLAQILPPDQQRALDEFGAIEHEILPPDGILDRFTVVAARGGEDVWVEVRRKPVPPPMAEAVETSAVPEFESAPNAVEPQAVVEQPAPVDRPPPISDVAAPAPESVHAEESVPTLEPIVEPPVDHPYAQADPSEMIVVALPGETSEEVSLNGVPDNAIQIIDDEPQGLPTEEEVDAMLAATASALLNSGLTVEDGAASTEIHLQYDEPETISLIDVSDISSATTGEHAPAEPAPVEPVAVEPVTIEPLTIAPLVVEPARIESVPAAPVIAERVELATVSLVESVPPEPAFVLSPPPEYVPEPAAAAPTESDDGAAEVPPGAPLFSEEAIQAAAPPPAARPIEEAPRPTEVPMDVTPEARQPEVIAPQGADSETRTGVVVPLGRSPIKTETITTPFTPAADAALTRTLRAAAARGAGTVYVVAQSKPMIRVDGDIVPLESEPTLTAADVDRLVTELAPPRRRDALQNGPVEWLCDVPEIGRVRCLTFRDHRGPGVLFRMFPARAISADQLGLTPEVQALCQQSDGLVLVTGGRASGKSTLLNAFVDLINRTRSDHVITVEAQIGFVHESRRSFISQRETRGDAELGAAVTRAAVREDPDVIMVEELKSAELVSAALEAAESGRLVLASVPAASTIGALERLLEVLPADRRAKARTSLAGSLRGVIAQVILRRNTGGRVAAREILLNTPAVSALVLEGKMFELPVALDNGRRHGMVPLTDSLAACVREGVVHPSEAYRKALDRAALVAALKRDGVDTSFAERLA